VSECASERCSPLEAASRDMEVHQKQDAEHGVKRMKSMKSCCKSSTFTNNVFGTR
jgi:hypothetical protein